MSYTHLQVRSGYSLFESTHTIETLVKKASELDFTALALTDEHVLYGAVSFYQTCQKYGIKPIIGMAIIVMMSDQTKESCLLLAKNIDGYKQLIKISSSINENQENTISFDVLHTYTADLICILPTATSTLAQLLVERTHDRALQYVQKWQNLVQEGDFYLGIEDHGNEYERIIQRPLHAFHEVTDIPVVAIQDVRYSDEQDDIAFDCFQAMKEGRKWSAEQMNRHVRQRHFRSPEEMKALFASFWPEVVSETEKIVEKCEVTFDFNQQLMPSFPVPNEQDSFSYLSEICLQQAKVKYGELSNEVQERLQYELNVIKSMQFSDYFLIVWDFIKYAKSKKILVGPGRGSSAGSIVAYVLDITEVDPLKHDLLFERFLNPERVTMPDIDIDFSDHRRDEVIEYVREKYGEDHVAQIITFGTFGARSVLRELSKTIGIAQEDVTFILQHIPVQGSGTIRDYVRKSEELTTYIKQSEQLQQLFAIATKLEGLPRHISTHAAGIVISEDQLLNHTPLTIGSNNTKLTQYAMDELEAIGLLKIDLLGLRNLSLLERIIETIQFHGHKRVNLQQFPEDDEKTFELLKHGKTNGIFQLESRGMKQVLQQLKPTNFHDIVAVNALYRPGPMDYIPAYINRKHGKEKIVYPHEDLMPILAPTFGVLVYQEQIMQISSAIAGMSYGEADLLRRAIATKKHELMNEQKEIFIRGCLNNGYDQQIAEEIFAWILKFSDYGFPKSHATAYSKISYELAYLKAHYPAYFFAELLSTVMNQHEKVNEYMKEANILNIEIAPPSINDSIGKYTVKDGRIQMGLLAIKGIGFQTVKEIIHARKTGLFKDIFDFCLRVSSKVANRSILEKLIMAGAFDETYNNRATLLASIDQAIEQGILFSDFTDQPSLLVNELELKATYTEMEDFSQLKKLSDEKDLLGIYVSSHPLSEYRSQLQTNKYRTLEKSKQLVGQHEVRCAAIIQAIKAIRTRRGDPMAFITIGDETTDMDAVVFPELYRKEKRWLKEEMIVFVTGKIELRNHRLQMVLSTIHPFNEQAFKISSKRIFIRLLISNRENSLEKIKKIAKNYPGKTAVIVYDEEEEKSYQLSNSYLLSPEKTCIEQLKAHFGETNVVLQK